MGDIDRTLYTQLDYILWDVRAKFVRPKDALKAYERKWRYIDESAMTEEETDLINQLVKEIGEGYFLPAA